MWKNNHTVHDNFPNFNLLEYENGIILIYYDGNCELRVKSRSTCFCILKCRLNSRQLNTSKFFQIIGVNIESLTVLICDFFKTISWATS